MIFVKWKEGLWARANIIELFQRGFTEAVRCCPVDQLESVQVFFIDYGITETISIARETDGHWVNIWLKMEGFHTLSIDKKD